MLTLLTSAGRIDLLEKTLESFYKDQQHNINLIIHEDNQSPDVAGMNKLIDKFFNFKDEIIYVNHLNQHKSIEQFLKNKESKYFVHLEDDWHFENTYDWISSSINIMEADQKIIKVLCRDGSPHPCDHKYQFFNNEIRQDRRLHLSPAACDRFNYEEFGFVEPWQAPDNVTWHGFSWNPGVTRFDLLKQFIPFPKWEQELAKNIFDAGYKVVELANPIYKHIGDGRSTHD